MTLAPENRNIWKINFMVITLLGCLTKLTFRISKNLNFGLKIGILKRLSKNSVSCTHSATLEICLQNSPKLPIRKNRKTHFRGQIWGQAQI